MTIETAPAPLVVYQRRLSVTVYEPPETATPELDDELTDPDDDCRLLEDELEEAVPDDVAAVLAVAVEEDGVVPGMVIALTVPKIATPAMAAKAMPAVIRSSNDRALSRA